MSAIDTRLPAHLRTSFLEEVRYHLPAFLSAAATKTDDYAGDVRDLLGLGPRDFERVVTTHVALSDEMTNFVDGLRGALRRPVTASERAVEISQSVNGPIDWGRTIRVRSATGGVTPWFACRPAERIFDTPENRALSYALQRSHNVLLRASRSVHSTSDGGSDAWADTIVRRLMVTAKARRNPWLRRIPPEWPAGNGHKRLTVARSRFYRHEIEAVVNLLDRTIDKPTPEDLTALLEQRYFTPDQDWKLFEVVVALRIARKLAELAIGKRERLLVGGTRKPFASYNFDDGVKIQLWYQQWPKTAHSSIQWSTQLRHEIDPQSARPDLVIERLDRDGSKSILLEMKASTNAKYLSQGLMQILGYLGDRPELFAQSRPAGWLVAPSSNAFIEHAQDLGSPLWVVSADSVAEAVVEQLLTGYT